MNALYQQLCDEIEQVAENTEFYEPIPIEKPLLEKHFPLSALPNPLGRFVKQVAESKQCPLEFVILPLLSILGSMIGNSRQIKIKNDWKEWAIVWTCVIGESGSGKTPALGELLEPIEEIENRFAADVKDDVEQYERDKLVFDNKMKQWLKNQDDPPPTKPDPVAPRRCRVSDITIEALAPLLRDNPRGLLLERDEIAGWVASFDQYKGGKGSDSSNWLSIFGGKSITIDRKSGELSERQIRIQNPTVSITGGTQPAILTRFLSNQHRESGLAARFLFVYRNPKPTKWDKRAVAPNLKARYVELINKLYGLKPYESEDGATNPVTVSLSPESEQVWESFYNSHSEELNVLTGDLAAAWSKLRSYAARIALIIHCVKEATGQSRENVIDEGTMLNAIRIIDWVKHETNRVYSLFSKSEEELKLQRNADRIQKVGGSISVRDASRSFKKSTTDTEKILRDLIKAGYGQWQEVDEQSPKVGRPKSRIFELFQEESDSNDLHNEDTIPDIEEISFDTKDEKWIDDW